MEKQADRIKRLQENDPMEAISTLLNSINNFFNNEIIFASEHQQTSLLFLGIHAAILTISETLFNKKGFNGYKLFLEKFVDSNTDDTKFSKIAEHLHNWRNTLVHQWLSSAGYAIGCDYNMNFGLQEREGTIFINPKVYCELYIKAFSGGKIWKYDSYLNKNDSEKAKDRIINKLERKI